MIRGTTRLAAVIGWPVDHSASPALLNAAFAATDIDAVLVPMGVPPDGFDAALAGLRAVRALGASVTVPHKLAAVAACDELSSAARAIAAVNCVHVDGKRLVGHNTDAGGFADALAEAGVAPSRAVLLGAGGAARAVAYGLAESGAEVEVVARRVPDGSWIDSPQISISRWDRLRHALARADLVVDCTPVGLGVDPEGEAAFVEALPLDALQPGATVATLVYHRRTRLLDRARRAGYPTLDGACMLVHQGARAFTIWTGVPAPIDAMTRALAALRSTDE